MTPVNKVARKAARLAALLPLWRSGQLDHTTYQEIADLIGAGHRSTALRTVRDLPEVERLREFYIAKLGGKRRKLHKRHNRNL